MKRLSLILFAGILSFIPRLVLCETKNLTILHFNDFHGHIETKCSEGKCKGGAARIAELIKNIETENKGKGRDTLVLFGGDAFSGTLVSSTFKGEAEFAFFNGVGVDAMVLGNHDFDFGVPVLQKRILQADFPVISANVYWKGTDNLFTKSYFLKEKGRLSIGIIGLTTPRTPSQTIPRNVAELSFRDVVKATQKNLDEIKNADIKIALTHMGVKRDVELAKKIKSFNAVIGGHDHVNQNEYCRTIRKVPVCQTPANGRFIGRLDFEIENKKVKFVGSSLIPIDEKISEDKEMLALLKPYEKEVEKEYKHVIGYSTDNLKRSRGKESPLGDIVADAIRNAADTQMAFINDGGIRNDLDKGSITTGEVAEILPFDNYIVSVKLTGAQIQDVLNHAVGSGSNAFLQVSGISFQIVDNKPVNIRVGDELIVPDKMYTAATVDFLVSGGDGYHMLKKADQEYTGVLMRDAMINYIKDKKRIETPASGRITE